MPVPAIATGPMCSWNMNLYTRSFCKRLGWDIYRYLSVYTPRQAQANKNGWAVSRPFIPDQVERCNGVQTLCIYGFVWIKKISGVHQCTPSRELIIIISHMFSIEVHQSSIFFWPKTKSFGPKNVTPQEMEWTVEWSGSKRRMIILWW